MKSLKFLPNITNSLMLSVASLLILELGKRSDFTIVLQGNRNIAIILARFVVITNTQMREYTLISYYNSPNFLLIRQCASRAARARYRFNGEDLR
jgi:hypothetical protein